MDKINLKVKFFKSFFGSYKEVRQVADIPITLTIKWMSLYTLKINVTMECIYWK